MSGQFADYSVLEITPYMHRNVTILANVPLIGEIRLIIDRRKDI